MTTRFIGRFIPFHETTISLESVPSSGVLTPVDSEVVVLQVPEEDDRLLVVDPERWGSVAMNSDDWCCRMRWSSETIKSILYRFN